MTCEVHSGSRGLKHKAWAQELPWQTHICPTWWLWKLCKGINLGLNSILYILLFPAERPPTYYTKVSKRSTVNFFAVYKGSTVKWNGAFSVNLNPNSYASCRKTEMCYCILLYYHISGIKCVVQVLYIDRKGSFSGPTHLRSKWAACGPPCKMSLTSLVWSLLHQF